MVEWQKDLFLWRVFLDDPQRHSDSWPESSQRLLKAFIAQPFLCFLLQLASNKIFSVWDQIVPDPTADAKGGVDNTWCPLSPFAYLWPWKFARLLLHLEGGRVGRKDMVTMVLSLLSLQAWT